MAVRPPDHDVPGVVAPPRPDVPAGHVPETCDDNQLSHPFDQSSPEDTAAVLPADASPSDQNFDCDRRARRWRTPTRACSRRPQKTGYPPRTDVTAGDRDSPSVDMYKAMNPFDAVSQPTPLGGEHARAVAGAGDRSRRRLRDVGRGRARSSTSTRRTTRRRIRRRRASLVATYGMPYRGQPSIVYRVPFTVARPRRRRRRRATTPATAIRPASTASSAPPDSTITTTRRAPARRGSQLVPTAATCIACAVTYDRRDRDERRRRARTRSPRRRSPRAPSTLSFVAPGVGGIRARSPATRSACARAAR